MAGNHNRPRDTFDELMRDTDRRINQQERRTVPTRASDLLGPGYAPRAVRILDWNQDETMFSGQFWSPVAAQNSPDSTYEWMGFSLTEDENFTGVQTVWTTGGPSAPIPSLRSTRRWYSLDGGVTRIFTPWSGETKWLPLTAGTGYGVVGSAEVKQQSGGTVAFRGRISRTTSTIPTGANENAIIVPAAVAAPVVSDYVALPGLAGNTAGLVLAVLTAGSRTIAVIGSGAPGAHIWLSGLSYPV